MGSFEPRVCPWAGVNAKQVAGQRAYDEGKVAVLAGLAAGVGMVMSQACILLGHFAL